MTEHKFSEEEIKRTQERAAKDAKSNKYNGPYGFGILTGSREAELEEKYYRPSWRNSYKQTKGN